MPNEITPIAKKILEAVDRISQQREAAKREMDPVKRDILNERVHILESIVESKAKELYASMGKVDVKANTPVKTVASTKFRNLSPIEKKRVIKELKIRPEDLEGFVKELNDEKKKATGLEKEDYNIYAPNRLGKFANKYAKVRADSLVEKNPKFFAPMFQAFERVDMPFLSRSYVSLMIFFTAISLPVGFVIFFLLNLSFQLGWPFVVALTILSPILTFFAFYFYPASLQGARERNIRNELPFAMVHMSAVAGSGAHPISIFELLVDSTEYPELKKEVRKVLNYVNLFGYNLTTAMNAVARTTPSKELKELFNGMVSTIETGGDLKAYLNEKSGEALNSYRLDRKKKVEALATYSEIYTAILIAAPLLMIISLAVMSNVGGDLGGVGFSTLAYGGIGVVLPLLNIGYMLFVNASQK